MKVEDYSVVDAESVVDLRVALENYWKNGYLPLGGMVHLWDDVYKKWFFIQTIVKYDSSPKKSALSEVDDSLIDFMERKI